MICAKLAALTIIELLKQRAAIVNYHDPYFPVLLKGRYYVCRCTRSPSTTLGVRLVAIITEHSDYEYPAHRAEAMWSLTLQCHARDRVARNCRCYSGSVAPPVICDVNAWEAPAA